MRSGFRRPSPSLVVSMLALLVALGGAGYAATGGTFILGASNTADKSSVLTGTVAGSVLQVANAGTSTNARAIGASSAGSAAPALNATNTGGGPAAAFTVNAGVAPFRVSTGTKVANLNADKLDNLSSVAFLRTLLDLNGRPCTAGTKTGVLSVSLDENAGGVSSPAMACYYADAQEPDDSRPAEADITNAFVSNGVFAVFSASIFPAGEEDWYSLPGSTIPNSGMNVNRPSTVHLDIYKDGLIHATDFAGSFFHYTDDANAHNWEFRVYETSPALAGYSFSYSTT